MIGNVGWVSDEVLSIYRVWNYCSDNIIEFRSCSNTNGTPWVKVPFFIFVSKERSRSNDMRLV